MSGIIVMFIYIEDDANGSVLQKFKKGNSEGEAKVEIKKMAFDEKLKASFMSVSFLIC